MSRYKITISYDGTGFAGWQSQKTGQAIQPLIQKAIEIVVRHPIRLTGSGRTDAGVHAVGQVAHFDSSVDCTLPRILYSFNSLLPPQIAISKIEAVADTFHARYSAKSKIYHYHLYLDAVKNPFTYLYRYPIRGRLNLERIQKAIPIFVGTHDFTAFANLPLKESIKDNPTRTLQRIDIVEEEGGVRFEFEADGFLYKMVRNLMGTLLDIGFGKQDPSNVLTILHSKDRKQAGAAAPAQGLFLMKVNYPPSQSLGISCNDAK